MSSMKLKTFKRPIIWTVILALIIAFFFTPYMNPPECPAYYTQAQIDAANGSCIVGANIGSGIYLVLIIPLFALIALISWVMAIFRNLLVHRNAKLQ